MASYTSTTDGNWSSTATWGGVGPPGAGDTATVNNNVTVTADTTIGDGTASTVLIVAPAAVGSLTITGATLTIRGNSTFGNIDADYTLSAIYDVLTLNPSGSTQGGIQFDGNSGITPVCVQGDYAQIVCNGTPGGHCFVRTRSGTAGNNAYFNWSTDAGNYESGFWYATYTDFTALGSASVPAILCNISTASGNEFVLDHCTATSCGQLPSLTSGYDASINISITNSQWITPLAAPLVIQVADTKTGGTRLIDSCIFGSRFLSYCLQGFTITNNYFSDGLDVNGTFPMWAVFDGNFWNNVTDSGEEGTDGPMTNNFFYFQNGYVHSTIQASNASYTVSYNVAEYAGSASAASMFGESEEAATPINCTYSYNIVYSSGSGSLGTIVNLNSNPSNPPNISLIYHNTFITNAANALSGSENGWNTDSVQNVRANIFYNIGSPTGVYVFKDNTPGGDGGPILNEMPAGAVLANSWYNYSTVSGNPFSAITGDTNVENGTPYYAPMSGATAPGAGDLANVDPGLADTTRTLATWDSVVQGGPGTASDAIARIQANPSLVKSSLLPWVRAGYVPTNTALRGASFAGDTSLTDAAGNPWAAGTPGIGAMSFATPPTGYTMTGPSSGDIGSASTNFTVTPGASGTYTFTPSDNGADGTFTPTTLTWSSSASPKTFTYTPVLWGTHTISGSIPTLTAPSALTYLAKVQLGSSGTEVSACRCPSLGGFSLFTTGAWWQELGRNISGDAVSSQSAALIALFSTDNLHIDFSAADTSGDALYGIPYNIVPGTQSLLPFSFSMDSGNESSQSDTGPVPYFPSMSIENWYSAGSIPPTHAQIGVSGSDSHALVYVRDETTGGIEAIWESWKTCSADSGATWNADQLSMWDVTTGYPRHEGWVSADAAGLAITPLLLNYDEVSVAVNHAIPIPHPIRCTIPSAKSRNTFVWPARCNALAGQATNSGLGCPYGTRFRLTSAWYATNLSSFSAVGQAVVTCLRNYGMIMADLADGIGLALEGVTDDRWVSGDLAALGAIPVSAFEIVDTINPPFTLTGPTTGVTGTPVTYTLTYTNSVDVNYATGASLYYSYNGGSPVGFYSSGSAIYNTVDLGVNRSINSSFTPDSDGTYIITNDYYGNYWMNPPPITLEVGTISSNGAVLLAGM